MVGEAVWAGVLALGLAWLAFLGVLCLVFGIAAVLWGRWER